MNFFDRNLMLLRTVRHLKMGQILSRCRHTLRRSWWAATCRRSPKSPAAKLEAPAPLYAGLPDLRACGPWDSQARASARQAEALGRGDFCFLNRRVVFPSQIRWHDPNLSQLWRYHLHYFDYLQDLLIWSALGSTAAAYDTFRSIASSWMDHNGLIRGDGWHPYTISIRLANWLAALSGFGSQLAADPEFDLRLRQSLSAQAQILSSDLETDVLGNHLIANLRALIFWGLAHGEDQARHRFEHSLHLLKHELAEQVLPDGGHFERSPGYHCLVLKHCLEIALSMRRKRATVPQWLDDALTRMLRYLMVILPLNGELPLLKDTTLDGTPPFDLLAAGALYLNDQRFKKNATFGLYPLLLFGSEGWNRFHGWPLNDAPEASRELADSRHYVMRDDTLGDHFIFDAGKPCPDYLPAHAHADLLSYELQVSGERIVVDSGVFEYTAGHWRDYFRSTRAHNTVELAGANQSEVWNSFRVARRARAGAVRWLNAPDYALVQGSHDGYMRLAVRASHRRTLLQKNNQYWLILDEILGAGSTQAASCLHLHPKLILKPIEEFLWRLDGADAALWVAAFGASGHNVVRGQMEPVRQGWYSERFGEMIPNTVLALDANGALPFFFGYVIFKGSAGSVEFHRGANGTTVAIVHNGRESLLSVSSDGTPEVK